MNKSIYIKSISISINKTITEEDLYNNAKAFVWITDRVYYNLFGHTPLSLMDIIYIERKNKSNIVVPSTVYEIDTFMYLSFTDEAVDKVTSIMNFIWDYSKSNLNGLVTEEFIKSITDKASNSYSIYRLPFSIEVIKRVSEIDMKKGLAYNALIERYLQKEFKPYEYR